MMYIRDVYDRLTLKPVRLVIFNLNRDILCEVMLTPIGHCEIAIAGRELDIAKVVSPPPIKSYGGKASVLERRRCDDGCGTDVEYPVCRIHRGLLRSANMILYW